MGTGPSPLAAVLARYAGQRDEYWQNVPEKCRAGPRSASLALTACGDMRKKLLRNLKVPAQRSVGGNFASYVKVRGLERAHGLHECFAGGLGGGEHGRELGRVAADGLLAEHVLAPERGRISGQVCPR